MCAPALPSASRLLTTWRRLVLRATMGASDVLGSVIGSADAPPPAPLPLGLFRHADHPQERTRPWPVKRACACPQGPCMCACEAQCAVP